MQASNGVAQSDQQRTEAKRVYCSKYYFKNKEAYVKVRQAYHSTVNGRARALRSAALLRSKYKKIDFSLSLEWIAKRLAAGECELTKLKFVFHSGTHKKNPLSPSLDRIDNSKGYTEDNCRIIVWAANAGIADFGIETYLMVAELVRSSRASS